MSYTLEQVKAKSAARLSGLQPVVRQVAEALIEFAYAHGVPIVITQGLRTIPEQDGLYAQGRTKPGQIVTNAKGGYSYHNFGVAIDFALLLPGGGVSWDMKRDGDGDGIADWQEVVDAAKRLGWEWGGDWTSFKDYPHFQIDFGLSTADYRAGKRPTSAQLANALGKITKTQEDEEMTAEEKKQFESMALLIKGQAEVTQSLTKRVKELEAAAKLKEIPKWALPACEAAEDAGYLDTTANGSYDFYRMVTILFRAGVFK
ncbi:L-alanyl-D-glutamate peptidase [Paenibacillus sp. FSL R7-269]|uniref:M15 family metallopeptidase n=1 Tax=Paenibacillus sp. FSL R7-269 TaxID=1226755 RepID=UPI0003E27B85|nr:M15 family metallopeptidase [Paenibacillus sp. FSL R7-269]ETT45202.1 L-alanyl-D-glutamate peptidase [Paenibacillus sp. FSL R7-269]